MVRRLHRRFGSSIGFVPVVLCLIGLEGSAQPNPNVRRTAVAERQPEESTIPSSSKLDLATASERLIEAHNRIRKAEKLPTLTSSKRLREAADLHAKDMAKRSKMSHEGSDGSSTADRIRAQKYDYRRIGENVAYGKFTIEQVMEGWMKSEGHRKNILGGFSQIGAAVVLDKDEVPYWCVTFGLPRRK